MWTPSPYLCLLVLRFTYNRVLYPTFVDNALQFDKLLEKYMFLFVSLSTLPCFCSLNHKGIWDYGDPGHEDIHGEEDEYQFPPYHSRGNDQQLPESIHVLQLVMPRYPRCVSLIIRFFRILSSYFRFRTMFIDFCNIFLTLCCKFLEFSLYSSVNFWNYSLS